MPRTKTITKKPATSAKKEVKEETITHKEKERYVEGVGRRKTAVARVRLVGGHGAFSVCGKKPEEYFHVRRFSLYATSPLLKLKLADKYDVNAVVSGGGVRAQAEAVRHGLSRALAIKNPDFRARLRKLGYLTRDSRMVERKKYGLKKARRAPQWQKR